MMKFKGSWDQFPEPENNEGPNDSYMLRAWSIPTVDEVNDVLSFMYADTVLQILRGQGIYRGYDCVSHADNEIRIYDFDSVTENRQQQQREYYQRRKERRIGYYFSIVPQWKLEFKKLSPALKKVIRKVAYARKTDLESAVKIMLPLLKND